MAWQGDGRSGMRRLAKLAQPGWAVPLVGGSPVRAGTRHAATAGRRQPGPSLIGPHDLSTPDQFRRPAGQRLLTGGAEP
jgi:hypothetical protein